MNTQQFINKIRETIKLFSEDCSSKHSDLFTAITSENAYEKETMKSYFTKLHGLRAEIETNGDQKTLSFLCYMIAEIGQHLKAERAVLVAKKPVNDFNDFNDFNNIVDDLDYFESDDEPSPVMTDEEKLKKAVMCSTKTPAVESVVIVDQKTQDNMVKPVVSKPIVHAISPKNVAQNDLKEERRIKRNRARDLAIKEQQKKDDERLQRYNEKEAIMKKENEIFNKKQQLEFAKLDSAGFESLQKYVNTHEIYSFSGNPEQVRLKMKEHPGMIFYKHSVYDKEYHYCDPRMMAYLMASTGKEYNEVVLDNPCNFYLDIEYYEEMDSGETDRRETFMKILKILDKTFNTLQDYKNPPNIIYGVASKWCSHKFVGCSSGFESVGSSHIYEATRVVDHDKKKMWKQSYHVIFPGIWMKNKQEIKKFIEKRLFPKPIDKNAKLTFGEIQQLKNETERRFTQSVIHAIDMNVYGRGLRLFRMPFTRKGGDESSVLKMWTPPSDDGVDFKGFSVMAFKSYKHHFVNYLKFGKKDNPELINYSKDTHTKRGNDKNSKKGHLKHFASTNLKSLEKLAELLDILSPKYYDDRLLWVSVGHALASHSTAREIIDLYIAFSRKSSHWSVKDGIRQCTKMIEDSKDRGLTIGTLYYYAKESNPEEYKKIIEKYRAYAPLNIEIKDYFDFRRKWHKKDLNLKVFLKDAHPIFKHTENPTDKMYVNYRGVYHEKPNRDFMQSMNKYHVSIKLIEAKSSISLLDKKNVSLGKVMMIKRALEDGEKPCEDKQKTIRIPVSFSSIIHKYIAKFDYRDILSDPGCTDETIFNLFRGLISSLIDNVDDSIIKLIITHIKISWANNNEEHYEYIINWLAYVVQNIGKKTGVCIVVIAKPGSGKTIMSNFLMKRIFGRDVAKTITGLKTVSGTFNGILENKLFIIFNEISDFTNSRENKSAAADALKVIITDDTLTLTVKNKTSKNVKCCINSIGFSNHENCIRIEDGDRRYAIFRGSDELIGNTAYFNKLGEVLDEQHSGDCFYTWLMRRDIRGFHPPNFPVSDQKKRAKNTQLCMIEKFLISEHEYLNEKHLTKKEFKDIFDSWMMSNRGKKYIGGGYVDTLVKWVGKTTRKQVDGVRKSRYDFMGFSDKIKAKYGEDEIKDIQERLVDLDDSVCMVV